MNVAWLASESMNCLTVKQTGNYDDNVRAEILK